MQTVDDNFVRRCRLCGKLKPIRLMTGGYNVCTDREVQVNRTAEDEAERVAAGRSGLTVEEHNAFPKGRWT